MPDREKVIKGLDIILNGCNEIQCEDCCFHIKEPTKPRRCGMIEEQIQEDALALLKEQEELGTELTNAVELIRKKNERIEKLLKEQEAQKFFVDESGNVTPLPVVVRCNDCKYNDDGECIIKAGWFPVKPDWYCADGERQEVK